MAPASARVGLGFDVHRFCPGRPLILGGIRFKHHLGLAGHSDADVLIHAVIDALLGAAGLGDIGGHFPDTDQKWHNADSTELLRLIMAEVTDAGWRVGNLDATIICEQPKIGPHRDELRARLAELLGVSPAAVNIKGKTAEQLGAIGRSEGIAAQAIALLEPV